MRGIYCVVSIVCGAVLAQSAWGQWRLLDPPLPAGPRLRHAMAFDSTRHEVVLFGGAGMDGTPTGDTRIFNGTSWRQAPAPGPPPRQSHALAYDAAHGAVVLFGGIDRTGKALADTWLWNGTSWTEIGSPIHPAGRVGHVMIYDEARQRVVLFGGDSLFGYLEDTWTWDGTQWEQQAAAAHPSARTMAAGAFDLTQEKPLLFGGLLSDGTGSNETWLWTGSTWMREAAGSSPPARWGHSIATAHSGSILLVGGVDPFDIGRNLEGVWIHHQGQWFAPPAADAPPATSYAAMAAAPSLGVLLCGGAAAGASTNVSGNSSGGSITGQCWKWLPWQRPVLRR